MITFWEVLLLEHSRANILIFTEGWELENQRPLMPFLCPRVSWIFPLLISLVPIKKRNLFWISEFYNTRKQSFLERWGRPNMLCVWQVGILGRKTTTKENREYNWRNFSQQEKYSRTLAPQNNLGNTKRAHQEKWLNSIHNIIKANIMLFSCDLRLG